MEQCDPLTPELTRMYTVCKVLSRLQGMSSCATHGAGNFTLVDVDLAGVVPPAVLEAFAAELGGRAARLAARAAAEAAAAEAEAAAERATAAAAKGPSAAELKVSWRCWAPHAAARAKVLTT
jgi:hypothetical protein